MTNLPGTTRPPQAASSEEQPTHENQEKNMTDSHTTTGPSAPEEL